MKSNRRTIAFAPEAFFFFFLETVICGAESRDVVPPWRILIVSVSYGKFFQNLYKGSDGMVPLYKLRTKTTKIATYRNQEEVAEPNPWLF